MRLIKWPFIILVIVSVGLLWYFWQDLTPGPLRAVAGEIDRVVSNVNRTGKSQEVNFVIPDSNAVVLISPPYASLDFIQHSLPDEVVKKVESEIQVGAETGHLFYILDDEVIDHRLLSYSAEPLLGMSERDSVTFLISKKETASRPVRIELINQ